MTARWSRSRRNAIDDLVFAKLEQCNVQPAAVCSDGVFVRRAYLDIIGTLPSGYEARGVHPGPLPEQAPRPD